MAHRPLRDVQFLGGAREALAARRGLEGLQRVQGREAADHSVFPEMLMNNAAEFHFMASSIVILGVDFLMIIREMMVCPESGAALSRPGFPHWSASGSAAARSVKTLAVSSAAPAPPGGAPISERSLAFSSIAAAAVLAGTIGFTGAAQAAGRPLCRPALAFTDVQFSPMQPPTMERRWSATVSVDASRCAANSAGYFEILFSRFKETAPEIDFREEFMWFTFDWLRVSYGWKWIFPPTRRWRDFGSTPSRHVLAATESAGG